MMDDFVEEFDSTSCGSSNSSSSSELDSAASGDSSCEASESELNESQEEHSVPPPPHPHPLSFRARSLSGDSPSSSAAATPTKRKRVRRKKVGLRKKLRTHIESVEEFNPEARDAQSAEFERIRRLELQRSISSYAEEDEEAGPGEEEGEAEGEVEGAEFPQDAKAVSVPGGGEPVVGASCEVQQRKASSSPEVLQVSKGAGFQVAGQPDSSVETIVIDSGSSDSDGTSAQQPHPPQRPLPQAVPTAVKKMGQPGVRPHPQAMPSGGRRGVGQPPQRQLLGKYDVYVPRKDGRVLINEGHAPSETDVFLAPQIAAVAKPHQIGGIRFLFDNVIESLSRFDSGAGFGCILAHSMGLGKTMQAIAFIDIFLRLTSAKFVMCVVPVNTLQNWMSEFDKWLPIADSTPTSGASSSGAGPGGVVVRAFKVFLLSESAKSMDSRLKVIKMWRETGGVLLIGYEMYRLLSLSVPSLGGNKMATKRKKTAARLAAASEATIDLDQNEKEMESLMAIQHALCNPGPDLVICDEGHRIKNEYSNISQALKTVRTKRRVVMTGYPLQNNLMEYWCMVDFVRPKFLGTKQEFADLFERPINNGQCVDSNTKDVELMRHRSHVLHTLLEGFVLRRGHEILRSTLPPKYEHVLFLRPSPVQGVLYNFAMEQIQNNQGTSSAGPLKAFALCSKIWNHPDVYYNEYQAQDSKHDSQTPEEVVGGGGVAKKSSPGESSGTSSMKLEWPSAPLPLPAYVPGHLHNSPKMVILFNLIFYSVHLGERILVFSQHLSTLSYIEKVLGQYQIPIPSSGQSLDPGSSGSNKVQFSSSKWMKNRNYYRLDGNTSSMERDKMITHFNSAENTQCWLFLISTKAGCLGINLVGANRVVVLDVSWNPCHDAQAVCRVYRYGQTKPSFIYRLVCDGTMERRIYDRQISKQGMSHRVVDELAPERHLTVNDIVTLMSPLTELPAPCDLASHAADYSFDPSLMELCKNSGQLLTKLPFKHESLLLDNYEERMTAPEKEVALRTFQRDLRSLRGVASNPASTRAVVKPLVGGAKGVVPSPPMLPRVTVPPVHHTTSALFKPVKLEPTTGSVPIPYQQQLRVSPVPSRPSPTPSSGAASSEVICLDSSDSSDEEVSELTTPSSQVSLEDSRTTPTKPKRGVALVEPLTPPSVPPKSFMGDKFPPLLPEKTRALLKRHIMQNPPPKVTTAPRGGASLTPSISTTPALFGLSTTRPISSYTHPISASNPSPSALAPSSFSVTHLPHLSALSSSHAGFVQSSLFPTPSISAPSHSVWGAAPLNPLLTTSLTSIPASGPRHLNPALSSRVQPSLVSPVTLPSTRIPPGFSTPSTSAGGSSSTSSSSVMLDLTHSQLDGLAPVSMLGEFRDMLRTELDFEITMSPLSPILEPTHSIPSVESASGPSAHSSPVFGHGGVAPSHFSTHLAPPALTPSKFSPSSDSGNSSVGGVASDSSSSSSPDYAHRFKVQRRLSSIKPTTTPTSLQFLSLPKSSAEAGPSTTPSFQFPQPPGDTEGASSSSPPDSPCGGEEEEDTTPYSPKASSYNQPAQKYPESTSTKFPLSIANFLRGNGRLPEVTLGSSSSEVEDNSHAVKGPPPQDQGGRGVATKITQLTPITSIPLLSPVAARLLYLSTGTSLPSSPPEDVHRLFSVSYVTPAAPSPLTRPPRLPAVAMNPVGSSVLEVGGSSGRPLCSVKETRISEGVSEKPKQGQESVRPKVKTNAKGKGSIASTTATLKSVVSRNVPTADDSDDDDVVPMICSPLPLASPPNSPQLDGIAPPTQVSTNSSESSLVATGSFTSSAAIVPPGPVNSSSLSFLVCSSLTTPSNHLTSSSFLTASFPTTSTLTTPSNHFGTLTSGTGHLNVASRTPLTYQAAISSASAEIGVQRSSISRVGGAILPVGGRLSPIVTTTSAVGDQLLQLLSSTSAQSSMPAHSIVGSTYLPSPLTTSIHGVTTATDDILSTALSLVTCPLPPASTCTLPSFSTSLSISTSLPGLHGPQSSQAVLQAITTSSSSAVVPPLPHNHLMPPSSLILVSSGCAVSFSTAVPTCNSVSTFRPPSSAPNSSVAHLIPSALTSSTASFSALPTLSSAPTYCPELPSLSSHFPAVTSSGAHLPAPPTLSCSASLLVNTSALPTLCKQTPTPALGAEGSSKFSVAALLRSSSQVITMPPCSQATPIQTTPQYVSSSMPLWSHMTSPAVRNTAVSEEFGSSAEHSIKLNGTGMKLSVQSGCSNSILSAISIPSGQPATSIALGQPVITAPTSRLKQPSQISRHSSVSLSTSGQEPASISGHSSVPNRNSLPTSGQSSCPATNSAAVSCCGVVSTLSSGQSQIRMSTTSTSLSGHYTSLGSTLSSWVQQSLPNPPISKPDDTNCTCPQATPNLLPFEVTPTLPPTLEIKSTPLLSSESILTPRTASDRKNPCVIPTPCTPPRLAPKPPSSTPAATNAVTSKEGVFTFPLPPHKGGVRGGMSSEAELVYTGGSGVEHPMNGGGGAGLTPILTTPTVPIGHSATLPPSHPPPPRYSLPARLNQTIPPGDSLIASTSTCWNPPSSSPSHSSNSESKPANTSQNKNSISLSSLGSAHQSTLHARRMYRDEVLPPWRKREDSLAGGTLVQRGKFSLGGSGVTVPSSGGMISKGVKDLVPQLKDLGSKTADIKQGVPTSHDATEKSSGPNLLEGNPCSSAGEVSHGAKPVGISKIVSAGNKPKPQATKKSGKSGSQGGKAKAVSKTTKALISAKSTGGKKAQAASKKMGAGAKKKATGGAPTVAVRVSSGPTLSSQCSTASSLHPTPVVQNTSFPNTSQVVPPPATVSEKPQVPTSAVPLLPKPSCPGSAAAVSGTLSQLLSSRDIQSMSLFNPTLGSQQQSLVLPQPPQSLGTPAVPNRPQQAQQQPPSVNVTPSSLHNNLRSQPSAVASSHMKLGPPNVQISQKISHGENSRTTGTPNLQISPTGIQNVSQFQHGPSSVSCCPTSQVFLRNALQSQVAPPNVQISPSSYQGSTQPNFPLSRTPSNSSISPSHRTQRTPDSLTSPLLNSQGAHNLSVPQEQPVPCSQRPPVVTDHVTPIYLANTVIDTRMQQQFPSMQQKSLSGFNRANGYSSGPSAVSGTSEVSGVNRAGVSISKSVNGVIVSPCSGISTVSGINGVNVVANTMPTVRGFADTSHNGQFPISTWSQPGAVSTISAARPSTTSHFTSPQSSLVPNRVSPTVRPNACPSHPPASNPVVGSVDSFPVVNDLPPTVSQQLQQILDSVQEFIHAEQQRQDQGGGPSSLLQQNFEAQKREEIALPTSLKAGEAALKSPPFASVSQTGCLVPSQGNPFTPVSSSPLMVGSQQWASQATPSVNQVIGCATSQHIDRKPSLTNQPQSYRSTASHSFAPQTCTQARASFLERQLSGSSCQAPATHKQGSTPNMERHHSLSPTFMSPPAGMSSHRVSPLNTPVRKFSASSFPLPVDPVDRKLSPGAGPGGVPPNKLSPQANMPLPLPFERKVSQQNSVPERRLSNSSAASQSSPLCGKRTPLNRSPSLERFGANDSSCSGKSGDSFVHPFSPPKKMAIVAPYRQMNGMLPTQPAATPATPQSAAIPPAPQYSYSQPTTHAPTMITAVPSSSSSSEDSVESLLAGLGCVDVKTEPWHLPRPANMSSSSTYQQPQQLQGPSSSGLTGLPVTTRFPSPSTSTPPVGGVGYMSVGSVPSACPLPQPPSSQQSPLHQALPIFQAQPSAASPAVYQVPPTPFNQNRPATAFEPPGTSSTVNQALPTLLSQSCPVTVGAQQDSNFNSSRPVRSRIPNQSNSFLHQQLTSPPASAASVSPSHTHFSHTTFNSSSTSHTQPTLDSSLSACQHQMRLLGTPCLSPLLSPQNLNPPKTTPTTSHDRMQQQVTSTPCPDVSKRERGGQIQNNAHFVTPNGSILQPVAKCVAGDDVLCSPSHSKIPNPAASLIGSSMKRPTGPLVVGGRPPVVESLNSGGLLPGNRMTTSIGGCSTRIIEAELRRDVATAPQPFNVRETGGTVGGRVSANVLPGGNGEGRSLAGADGRGVHSGFGTSQAYAAQMGGVRRELGSSY